MTTAKYVYWQDGPWWLGYLEEFPGCSTQGESHDNLIVHLKDLLLDFLPSLPPEQVGRVRKDTPMEHRPNALIRNGILTITPAEAASWR